MGAKDCKGKDWTEKTFQFVMMVLIKPSLAPSKASTFHVNLKAGHKSSAVDVHVQLHGQIVFPYVDVLKPCSLEVIWSQSGLAISRKSCHPQLLLSWCRLASFSCVRARSNQSPTVCLRLSSSTEKNAKLLLSLTTFIVTLCDFFAELESRSICACLSVWSWRWSNRRFGLM